MKRLIHATVVLLGAGWLFVHVSVLRTSLVVFTDSLAHAFEWIGVTDPGLAWLLLGVVGGGIAGAAVGMRRAGRPISPRQIRGTAVLVGGAMLVAGSYAPSRVAAAPDRTARVRPVAPGVHLATGRIALHAEPDRASAVTGTAPAHARLAVLDTSSDGDWVYVEGIDRSGLRGWTPRTSLSEGALPATRARVARSPGRADSTASASGTYAASGEVQLGSAATPHIPGAGAPSAGTFSAGTSSAGTPNAGTPDRDAAAPQVAVDSAPAGEVADPAVVADVQTSLANARSGARTGDFSAALRALAGADESVTLAITRYDGAGWIASLRRDVASARATVRTACQGAVAAANRRGDPAPRCE